MAKPVLTSPTDFPSKLHKRKGHDDPATIFGENIAVGDTVRVQGTHGHWPTTWVGSIGADNGDGSFDVDDLTVHDEEKLKSKKDVDDAGGGGAEDVSVTVSNATDTSVPVTTPSVPTIP
jgi:hypothetical protein